jgi:hypothetical protein
MQNLVQDVQVHTVQSTVTAVTVSQTSSGMLPVKPVVHVFMDSITLQLTIESGIVPSVHN